MHNSAGPDRQSRELDLIQYAWMTRLTNSTTHVQGKVPFTHAIIIFAFEHPGTENAGI